MPGRHLILVHYDPESKEVPSWVYNSADIDNSKIVWAHDMGMAQNEELVHYCVDRHVWFFDPGKDDTQLTPYSSKTNLPITSQQAEP